MLIGIAGSALAHNAPPFESRTHRQFTISLFKKVLPKKTGQYMLAKESDRLEKFLFALIKILLIYAVSISFLVLLLTWNKPQERAVAGMALAAFFIWVIFFGALMYRFRRQICNLILAIPLPWQFKFVVLATGLALLEEAVTVSLTNLAPLFGGTVGQSYITASTNYLDVVLFHSVIIFIPMFIAWAWALTRYRFSPVAVFFIWGITGWILEISFSGPGQLLSFAFWIFIYGTMIWLPAFCIPERREAKLPKTRHYFIPFLAMLAAAVIFFGLATLLGTALKFNPFSGHPKFHFLSSFNLSNFLT